MWICYLDKLGVPKADQLLWWKLRAKRRKSAKFCKFCGVRFSKDYILVIDHKKPHRGDVNLLLDPNNLQDLCKKCHDQKKQLIELNEKKPAVGYDGWQIK